MKRALLGIVTLVALLVLFALPALLGPSPPDNSDLPPPNVTAAAVKDAREAPAPPVRSPTKTTTLAEDAVRNIARNGNASLTKVTRSEEEGAADVIPSVETTWRPPGCDAEMALVVSGEGMSGLMVHAGNTVFVDFGRDGTVDKMGKPGAESGGVTFSEPTAGDQIRYAQYLHCAAN